MIDAGHGTWVNPAFVASMEFDRRYYVNGPGDTVLVITMHDGTQHRIRHEPQYLGGTDAYEVQKAIVAAQSFPHPPLAEP